MVFVYIFLNRHKLWFLKDKFLIGFFVSLVLVSFFAQIRFPIIEKFSFTYLKDSVISKDTPSAEIPTPLATNQEPEQQPAISSLTSGGSQSNQIRNIVWRGGLDAWKANPIFGTGVETFAFAYYKFRPVEHNNVSEWNFLYNKAHNEYINYLTTTGIVGFLSYMTIIIVFIALALINIFNAKIKQSKFTSYIRAPFNLDKSDPLILSLLSSFIFILILNFFGFSVVILNIFLFLIPAFTLILLQLLKQEEPLNHKLRYVSYAQWSGVGALLFTSFVVIFVLIRFWVADTSYALGTNYNKAGDYQTAYPLLLKAVDIRKEPVFEDELAVNKAVLALQIAQQQGSASGELIGKLAQESIATNDKLLKDHPNNILYLKSRVRILYTLSSLDPRFLPAALEAIQKAAALAPTDTSILYNLGVLYGQNGDSASAVKVLEQTVAYRPQYREARYALALFYHDLGVDATTGKIKDAALRQKAIDQLNYILQNLDPNYPMAKESLSAWENEK